MTFHSYSVKFLMFVFVCFFVTGCVVAFAVNRFLLNVTNLMTALVTSPKRGKGIASACLCMSVFLSTRISPKPFVQTPLSFMFVVAMAWSFVTAVMLCTTGARFTIYPDCFKFIARSTYDSDLRCAKISLRNIIS